MTTATKPKRRAPANPEEWLTPTEAAKHLKLSVGYLRLLRGTRAGPRFKVLPSVNGTGQRPMVRYRRAWLDAWLERQG